MFRRKDTDQEKTVSTTEDLGIPMRPIARPASAAPPSVPTPAAKGPVLPVSPAAPPRPIEATRVTELPRRDAAPAAAAPKRAETEMRTLIVGREIALSGEITSCDRLVVEGSVEANLANCRDIDIAESGLFKGSAAIEEAEIRGRFEGVLTVKKRLLIRSTGKVVGTVRYGQIEIERGGQLSGDVQSQPEGEMKTGGERKAS